VETLVIGKTIDGSYFYAKDVFLGKWQKWILLLCSCILFPLFLGYSMRIYRGANPAPELNDWGGMFIDGIKFMIVGAIYALPVLILDFALIGSFSLVILSSMKTYPGGMYIPPNAIMGLLLAVFLGALIIVIVAIILGLIFATAIVRFARTNSFSEAFNFEEISHHIGRIGWMTYITALIMMVIIVGLVEVVSLVMPIIGIVVFLILLPFLGIFSARYLTLLYEIPGTPA